MDFNYFPFPDTIRESQRRFIETIIESDSRFHIVSAATGTGKTAASITAALNLRDIYLNDVDFEWEQIFYLTPKHSQRKIVLETVKKINQLYEKNIRVLDWKPKEKTCYTNRDCSYRKCPFLGKYHIFVSKSLSMEKPPLPSSPIWDAVTVHNFAQIHGICPYYAQKYLAPMADVLLLDYNHIYARIFPVPDGLLRRGVLIVDEAQNLPDRVRGYYRLSIGMIEIADFGRSMEDASDRVFRFYYQDIRETPSGYISGIPRDLADDEEEELEEFMTNIATLKNSFPEFMRELSDSMKKIVGKKKLFDYSDLEFDYRRIKDMIISLKGCIRFMRDKFEEKDMIRPFERILRFLRYWTGYASSESTIRYWIKEPDDLLINLRRIEVGDIIREISGEFKRVIYQSATLFPIDFYIHEFGLDGFDEDLNVQVFPSPFPAENRLIRIVPEPKLTFENWGSDEKSDDTMKSLSYILGELLEAIPPGRVGVFCASSGLCERLRPYLEDVTDRSIVYAPSVIKTFVKEKMLSDFFEKENAVLLTPQGGSLTEGVDYPGDKLIAAFIVGIPITKYDENHRIVQEYYRENYGRDLGFLYSTVYPAVAKSIQAAGRVIRTESDRGVVIFIDKRWAWRLYNSSFPREWYLNTQYELISRSLTELKVEIKRFYSRL